MHTLSTNLVYNKQYCEQHVYSALWCILDVLDVFSVLWIYYLVYHYCP